MESLIPVRFKSGARAQPRRHPGPAVSPPAHRPPPISHPSPPLSNPRLSSTSHDRLSDHHPCSTRAAFLRLQQVGHARTRPQRRHTVRHRGVGAAPFGRRAHARRCAQWCERSRRGGGFGDAVGGGESEERAGGGSCSVGAVGWTSTGAGAQHVRRVGRGHPPALRAGVPAGGPAARCDVCGRGVRQDAHPVPDARRGGVCGRCERLRAVGPGQGRRPAECAAGHRHAGAPVAPGGRDAGACAAGGVRGEFLHVAERGG
eukprot:ctg_325.g91